MTFFRSLGIYIGGELKGIGPPQSSFDAPVVCDIGRSRQPKEREEIIRRQREREREIEYLEST